MIKPGSELNAAATSAAEAFQLRGAVVSVCPLTTRLKVNVPPEAVVQTGCRFAGFVWVMAPLARSCELLVETFERAVPPFQAIVQGSDCTPLPVTDQIFTPLSAFSAISTASGVASQGMGAVVSMRPAALVTEMVKVPLAASVQSCSAVTELLLVCDPAVPELELAVNCESSVESPPIPSPAICQGLAAVPLPITETVTPASKFSAAAISVAVAFQARGTEVSIPMLLGLTERVNVPPTALFQSCSTLSAVVFVEIVPRPPVNSESSATNPFSSPVPEITQGLALEPLPVTVTLTPGSKFIAAATCEAVAFQGRGAVISTC